MARSLTPSEDQLHMAVAEWVVLNEPRWPDLKFMYHCPNGGMRNKAVAGKLKAMLVRKGISDLILPIRRAQKIGLIIELKVGNKQPTPEQQAFLDRMTVEGWYCSVCRTPEDAIGRIAGYISL